MIGPLSWSHQRLPGSLGSPIPQPTRVTRLVGGFKHFSIIYGIIFPIDELMFFKMVIAPPTSRVCWIFQPNPSHSLQYQVASGDRT